MPEVAGDAALLVDPSDAEHIAHAMEEISGNENKRNQMIKKGFERLSAFSWDTSAKKTYDVLKAITN